MLKRSKIDKLIKKIREGMEKQNISELIYGRTRDTNSDDIVITMRNLYIADTDHAHNTLPKILKWLDNNLENNKNTDFYDMSMECDINDDSNVTLIGEPSRNELTGIFGNMKIPTTDDCITIYGVDGSEKIVKYAGRDKKWGVPIYEIIPCGIRDIEFDTVYKVNKIIGYDLSEITKEV